MAAATAPVGCDAPPDAVVDEGLVPAPPAPAVPLGCEAFVPLAEEVVVTVAEEVVVAVAVVEATVCFGVAPDPVLPVAPLPDAAIVFAVACWSCCAAVASPPNPEYVCR